MMRQPLLPGVEPHAGALLSEDRIYRYTLFRSLDHEHWASPRPTVLFIMLNPSTADEETNDPTIENCIRLARGWGAKRLAVCNLFAYRATDPKELQKDLSFDIVGPDNDRHLLAQAMSDQTRLICCAWGNHGSLRGRAETVRQMLKDHKLYCLKKTLSGEPVHPLYQKCDSLPVEYRYP